MAEKIKNYYVDLNIKETFFVSSICDSKYSNDDRMNNIPMFPISPFVCLQSIAYRVMHMIKTVLVFT